MVVPALVLLGGMKMHKAVGTSLMVIALKSFAAFVGHASHVSINVNLALTFTGAAIGGSLLGVALSKYIPAVLLRKIFAVFVLLMAGYVVWREAGIEYVGLLFLGIMGILGVNQLISHKKKEAYLH